MNARRFADAAAAYSRLIAALAGDDPDADAVDAELAAADAALDAAHIDGQEALLAAEEADRLRRLAAAMAEDHRQRLAERRAEPAPAALGRALAYQRASAPAADGDARFLDQRR